MNFPDLEASLLKERGISEADTESFLHPKYDSLLNPLDLPDMEKARDRVIEAMEKNEHIVVYSDYDADGIPGAVVLSDFFKRAKYDNVSFYIPHRHDEGFGLNIEAMDVCVSRGAKLLITIDCGIADVKEVEHICKSGVDVIITDHHEPGKVLPPAYAVVDPKRADSKYEFKEICGSAVAFKLIQAILEKEKFGIKEGMEKWSLDMVGIATLSDMVPLLGENRVFATFGLDVLKKSPRPGLAALMRILRMTQEYLTEDDITFMITPRINAASRMGVPMDAFKLLSTMDTREAEEMALYLEKINKERKTLVATVVKDAKAHLLKREIREVIVVGNPEWKPALMGLVANSLVEEYSRPVFVWGRDGDGVIKGSCRSYNGFNLYTLMSTTPESFLEYGGHAGAGGFSASVEGIAILEERLTECFKTLSAGEEAKEIAEEKAIDITPEEIGEDLWKTVSKFAPFGVGNPKPLFKIKAEIKEVRMFGKSNEHLEITIQPNIKAISFFSSPDKYEVSLEKGSKVNLLAHLEKSYFRDRPELRLRIVDIV